MNYLKDKLFTAFLTSLVEGFTSNVWIGLQDFKRHRQFLWTDNSPLKYYNWNSGEPNGRTAIVNGQGFVSYVSCNRFQIGLFEWLDTLHRSFGI